MIRVCWLSVLGHDIYLLRERGYMVRLIEYAHHVCSGLQTPRIYDAVPHPEPEEILERRGRKRYWGNSPRVPNQPQGDNWLQVGQEGASAALFARCYCREGEREREFRFPGDVIGREEEPTRTAGRLGCLIIQVGGWCYGGPFGAGIQEDRRRDVRGSVLDHSRVNGRGGLEGPVMVEINRGETRSVHADLMYRALGAVSRRELARSVAGNIRVPRGLGYLGKSDGYMGGSGEPV